MSDNRAEYEDIVEGRNSVFELLESGRDINKLLIQKGERHGSIHKIIAMAKERGIIVVEAERNKLDKMSETKNHQGAVSYTHLIF